MRIIHLKLNHCEDAALKRTLMSPLFMNKNLHHSAWETDARGNAVVRACGNRTLQQTMKHHKHDIVSIEINDLYNLLYLTKYNNTRLLQHSILTSKRQTPNTEFTGTTGDKGSLLPRQRHRQNAKSTLKSHARV